MAAPFRDYDYYPSSTTTLLTPSRTTTTATASCVRQCLVLRRCTAAAIARHRYTAHRKAASPERTFDLRYPDQPSTLSPPP